MSYPHPYPSAPSWDARATRRRRSRWLTVGLPVGLVVLALVVLGIVALVHTVSGAVAPVRAAAQSYADALVERRWAQGQLCMQDRAAVTPDQLAAHYASPWLTGSQITGVAVQDMNGQQSASVELVLTTANGLNTETTVAMVREDDAWRPCP